MLRDFKSFAGQQRRHHKVLCGCWPPEGANWRRRRISRSDRLLIRHHRPLSVAAGLSRGPHALMDRANSFYASWAETCNSRSLGRRRAQIDAKRPQGTRKPPTSRADDWTVSLSSSPSNCIFIDLTSAVSRQRRQNVTRETFDAIPMSKRAADTINHSRRRKLQKQDAKEVDCFQSVLRTARKSRNIQWPSSRSLICWLIVWRYPDMFARIFKNAISCNIIMCLWSWTPCVLWRQRKHIPSKIKPVKTKLTTANSKHKQNNRPSNILRNEHVERAGM